MPEDPDPSGSVIDVYFTKQLWVSAPPVEIQGFQVWISDQLEVVLKPLPGGEIATLWLWGRPGGIYGSVVYVRGRLAETHDTRGGVYCPGILFEGGIAGGEGEPVPEEGLADGQRVCQREVAGVHAHGRPPGGERRPGHACGRYIQPLRPPLGYNTAECGGHRRPVRHRFPLLAFMRCGSISRPQRNHGQRRSSHRPGPSQVLRQRRPPYNHPVHLQAVSSRFPRPPADVLAMPPSK